MATVLMDEAGNLRLPEELREALGLRGAAELEAYEEDGSVLLRPVHDEADDDSWAERPDVIARVRESQEQGRKGLAVQLSVEELLRLAGDNGE